MILHGAPVSENFYTDEKEIKDYTRIAREHHDLDFTTVRARGLGHSNSFVVLINICLEPEAQGHDVENSKFICDYVCPDTQIACGHRDLNESFLNVHKSKYSHDVFGKGRTQYQCDGCRMIFQYWGHWYAHECTNLDGRNLEKYPKPILKIPDEYRQIMLKSKEKRS